MSLKKLWMFLAFFASFFVFYIVGLKNISNSLLIHAFNNSVDSSLLNTEPKIKAGSDVVLPNNLPEEKILLFDSLIQIDPETTWITVTEKIVVNSNNYMIKHGIYRDFPLTYKAMDTGETYKVKFKFLSAELDNTAVNYKIERIANGVRIYLGDSRYYVDKGLHTYIIKYKTAKQLSLPKEYPDKVELFWNVNGNDWEFPIDKVVAKVELFSGLMPEDLKYKAYTGFYGDKGEDYKVYTKNNYLVFETTRSFEPKENLSIVVLFPKDVFNVNNLQNSVVNRILDNLGLSIAVILFFVVSYFVFQTWEKVGKDPELGSVMPMFKPPENIDPVFMRYIYKLKDSYVDARTLSAIFVYLATKGYIKILEPKKGKFKIQLVKWPENIDSWEYKFLKAVLEDNSEVELNRDVSTGAKLVKATNVLQQRVKGASKAYYKSNILQSIKYGVIYVFALMFSSVVAYFRMEIGANQFFMFFWGILFVGVWMFLIFAGIKYWLKPRNPIKITIIFGIITTIILILLNQSIVWGVISGLYLFAIMFVSDIMPAYTDKGMRLYRDVLGFKSYIETAEKDRLNVLNPPELTPELFEKYLPFAIALEVEHKWAKKFEKVFKRLQEQGEKYLTDWYDGVYNMTLVDKLNKFSSHLSTGLSSTITSAGKLHSASSGGFSGGFSSGGFSGGGGGGGGGGGW